MPVRAGGFARPGGRARTVPSAAPGAPPLPPCRGVPRKNGGNLKTPVSGSARLWLLAHFPSTQPIPFYLPFTLSLTIFLPTSYLNIMATDITLNKNNIIGDTGLPAKELIFADEYLTGEATGRRFHGPSAYVHAGYKLNKKNPTAHPSDMLAKPRVKAYISRRMMEASMGAQEVLARFTDIARSEFGEVLELNPNTQTLKINYEKVLKFRRHIKNFTYDGNGQPKLEFHDPMQALMQIARILGLNKDHTQLTLGGTAKLEVVFKNPDGTLYEIPDAEYTVVKEENEG